jgi:hypothetical protein
LFTPFKRLGGVKTRKQRICTSPPRSLTFVSAFRRGARIVTSTPSLMSSWDSFANLLRATAKGLEAVSRQHDRNRDGFVRGVEFVTAIAKQMVNESDVETRGGA